MGYIIIDTLTLAPLTQINNVWQYDFGSHCISTTATTSFTICNLLSTDYILNWTGGGVGFDSIDFSGITLAPYGTYTFDIDLIPPSVNNFDATWTEIHYKTQMDFIVLVLVLMH